MYQGLNRADTLERQPHKKRKNSSTHSRTRSFTMPTLTDMPPKVLEEISKHTLPRMRRYRDFEHFVRNRLINKQLRAAAIHAFFHYHTMILRIVSNSQGDTSVGWNESMLAPWILGVGYYSPKFMRELRALHLDIIVTTERGIVTVMKRVHEALAKLENVNRITVDVYGEDDGVLLETLVQIGDALDEFERRIGRNIVQQIDVKRNKWGIRKFPY